MTIYKQVNSPAAVAVEDVKVFMDRSESAGRCRCRPLSSGERLTPRQDDGFLSGRVEAALSRNDVILSADEEEEEEEEVKRGASCGC
ncbi:hypothetical protein ABVT39_004764 [Epinephelus coioides]